MLLWGSAGREPGVWDLAGEMLCCASGLGKRWVGWEICQRAADGVWQESTQDVVAWGEAMEALCFRKMGDVM